jgi:hypothetical protein
MVELLLMVDEHSQEKIHPRLIEVLHMRFDMSQKILLPQDSLKSV